MSIDPLSDTVRPLLHAWAADKGIELYEMAERASLSLLPSHSH